MNRVEQLYGKVTILELLRVWHPRTQWFYPRDNNPLTMPEWIERGATRFQVRLKTATSYVEPDIASIEATQLLAQLPLIETMDLKEKRIVTEGDGSRGQRRA